MRRAVAPAAGRLSQGSTVKGSPLVERSVRPRASMPITLRGRSGAARSSRIIGRPTRSEEHTSELQSRGHLVCRLLLEKKKTQPKHECWVTGEMVAGLAGPAAVGGKVAP